MTRSMVEICLSACWNISSCAAGPAGRQYDTYGEAIIVSESGVYAEDLYDHYVLGSPEPLRSQLSSDNSIRFHLLSNIATVPGMKKPEIHDLFARTLFARQYMTATVEFKVESALEYLRARRIDQVKERPLYRHRFWKTDVTPLHQSSHCRQI